jgi:hypothetical protein
LELFSNVGLTVKDKAGTTKTSAVSKEIITITDKENRKQDIEKLNRNIEDSLKKLKEIFDNKSRRKTGTHPHDEHSGEPNHP